eukprot:jgi/Tetstr1/458565/TSEL_044968.t1
MTNVPLYLRCLAGEYAPTSGPTAGNAISEVTAMNPHGHLHGCNRLWVSVMMVAPVTKPAPIPGATGMDDDDLWADEENKEQVGPGGGLADRAVRRNNESTADID